MSRYTYTIHFCMDPTRWAPDPATHGVVIITPINWPRNKWVCLGVVSPLQVEGHGPQFVTGSWANSSPNSTKELDEKHESYTQPT